MSRPTAAAPLKWLSILALTFLAGCGASVDLEVARKFQAAQTAAQRATSPEDHLRIAAQYQEILDGGTVSGAVLFNQGNAYMQAGRRGWAVASYQQARRYRMRDPFLDANLRLARGDAPTPEYHRSLAGVLLFWEGWLSTPEVFSLLGWMAAWSCGFGIAALWYDQRAWLRVAAWIGLGATLLLGISALRLGREISTQDHGVIVVPETLARKGSGHSWDPAFDAPLREGTEFRILESRAGWLRVEVADHLEGWVEAEHATRY